MDIWKLEILTIAHTYFFHYNTETWICKQGKVWYNSKES